MYKILSEVKIRKIGHKLTSCFITAGSAKGIDIWDPAACNDITSDKFLPRITDEERDIAYDKWKIAVEKSLGWCTNGEEDCRNGLEKTVMSEKSFKLYGSVAPALFAFSTFIMIKIASWLHDNGS